MTAAGRRAALDAIAGEISNCTRCRLHQGRTRAVPGEGNPETEVAFVGEAPGFNEDRQARPFVGQAGALLEELLRSVGWSREEVFITNVVKCRPPENRDPEPEEIAACAPFLTRQLEVLDPALVVTLGRFSMARFSPGARIGQVHGTFRPADAASGAPEALAFAMYHPAAALHQGSLKATLMRDMQGVPQALLEARERRGSMAGPEVLSNLTPQPAEAPGPSEPTGPLEAPGSSESTRPVGEGELMSLVAPGEIAPEAESDPAAQLTFF